MIALVANLDVSDEPSEHRPDNYVVAVVNAGLMAGTGHGI